MHRLDPVAPHKAAPFLARLVACGLLGRAEALAALLHAKAPAELLPCGRKARLTYALDDATAAAHRHRNAAARATRHAIAPLLERKAPQAVLRATALQAGRPALRVREIEDVLANSIALHLRQLRQSAHKVAA